MLNEVYIYEQWHYSKPGALAPGFFCDYKSVALCTGLNLAHRLTVFQGWF
jgi:hypothetical protein